MSPLLRLAGLQVRVEGRTLLDIPALEVMPGEILVVLGPTGAGKSTLLRVLSLLQRPDAGRIHWQGNPVSWPAPLELRRRITMAFQDPLLFSGTTLDNVLYGLHLRGTRGEAARVRARELMELLHIAPLAEQKASTLSGGEAQRTALARALAVRPELLLLDEPLASLDAPIRERLVKDLKAVLRELGLTCIFVTHHQREALALADRIAVLHRGRLEQVGLPQEVFRRPATPFVAAFVRTLNLWPGRVVAQEGGRATVDLGALSLRAHSDLPSGTPVLACLRPERAVLGETLPPGAQGWEATLREVQDQGSALSLTLDGALPLRALAGTCDRTQDSRLAVQVRPEDLHLIPVPAEREG